VTALVISNVALWVLVVVLSLVILALVRQLGVLHERITPVGALMLARGLKVGELAPAVNVEDLDRRPLTLGGPRGDGRSTLVMFISPTCPVCKALLPVLKSSRKSEQSWLEIVLASDGELASQKNFVLAQGLGSFPYVVSAPLGMTYQVSRLPFAVLIDADGTLRARGIINSREHLESLFEAKRLGVAALQDYLEAAGRDRAA
jgi:methylamine dehydrogenase accessory protein MauD